MANPATSAAPIRRLSNWIGVLPFALFIGLFLVLPTANVVIGAFRAPDGGLTVANLSGLGQERIRTAFWLSVKLSAITAVLGCAIGFVIAAAVTRGGLPRVLRAPMLSFSGVAANFAGVPLAFAFIATLGRMGFVTLLLRELFGFNLYASGFNLVSMTGLVLTYLYFQIPLMILVIQPALDGLKSEWREAAECLGASQFQYWRMVVFPILWPAILGALALLFANAFGAVATAMALTGSFLSLAPILLFAQVRGDVLQDPTLGYVIAFGMIVLTGAASLVSIWLRNRAERWLK